MSKVEQNIWSENVHIVAEIGMTHDGSFGLAKKLIESAADSGADIVKLQWHIAEEETVADAPAPPYFSAEPRYEYFKRTEFSEDQFQSLSKFCKTLGVQSCVSVFSIESARRAVKAGFNILKIPSGEVTNLPLMEYLGTLKLPILLSSGMSTWAELDAAVGCLSNIQDLVILQCSSKYPTTAEHVGLNVLSEIKERYNRTIGLSDHTLSAASAVAAVCFGARVIEKHFTLSKLLYGPDARFSLEPDEFKQLVSDTKFVFQILNSPIEKDSISQYLNMKKVFQKSIVAKHQIHKGQLITMDDLAFKKPGDGICASKFRDLIGSVASKDYSADEFLIESIE